MIWKRTLFVLLVTFSALPLQADDYTYTNGNSSYRWKESGQWSSSGWPDDGDRAIFDEASASTVPNDALPVSADGTINFRFNLDNSEDFDIAAMLDGGDPAAIGDVDVQSGYWISTSLNVTGSVTLNGTPEYSYAYFYLKNGVTVAGTVTVGDDSGSSAYFMVADDATATVAGLITLTDNANGGVPATGVLDANGGITISGTGNRAIICNYGEIKGWVNAAGNEFAWQQDGGKITVDVAGGTLDLGQTTDNATPVDIQANVTIGNSFRCHKLTGTGGVITGDGHTVTVGSGGLARVGSTLDAAGTLHVTFAEGTTAAEWETLSCLGTVTFNAAVTIGDADLICQKVAGAGSITSEASTKELFLWEPGANDFWTHTGDVTTTGTGEILIRLAAARSNAAAIGGAGSNADFAIWCANGVTFTASSDVTLGTGDLRIYASEDGWCGLQADGNLTVADVVLGHATDGDRDGRLTVSAGGTHIFAGVLARGAAATNGNEVTLAGRVTFGGHVVFAGTTAHFTHARIDTGAISIIGTGATGISNAGALVTGRTGATTFTDINTNWTAGNPAIFARRWTDGGGNGVRVRTLAPHWMGRMR